VGQGADFIQQRSKAEAAELEQAGKTQSDPCGKKNSADAGGISKIAGNGVAVGSADIGKGVYVSFLEMHPLFF
jgi:hypothetical protein